MYLPSVLDMTGNAELSISSTIQLPIMYLPSVLDMTGNAELSISSTIQLPITLCTYLVF